MKITKEIVLANLDQIKEYISEAETKKEEKTIGIAIKNHFTGSIIFQSTKTTYKDAVEEANLFGADLFGADLREADLREADLFGANLFGAELSCAKFYGKTSNPKTLKQSQVKDFLMALGFKVED